MNLKNMYCFLQRNIIVSYKQKSGKLSNSFPLHYFAYQRIFKRKDSQLDKASSLAGCKRYP